MKRVLIAVTASSMLSISSAQTSQSVFEVTSIRRNLSGDSRSEVSYQPGRFVAENATTKMVIAYAYDVKEFQISGGQRWLDDERVLT
jgi:uncharacterized protein (TIGR03435 family)